MRKFILSLVAVMALTFSAKAQESQVGAYADLNRSDATAPKNGYGGGILAVGNFKYGAVLNDFAGSSNSAYPNNGYVLNNETKLRINLLPVTSSAQLFGAGSMAIRHQDSGTFSATEYNPLLGAGFNFSNRVVATYDYMFSPNSSNPLRGHRLGVEGYVPVSERVNLIVGANSMAGRFNNNFFRPENFSNTKVYVGFSWAKRVD